MSVPGLCVFHVVLPIRTRIPLSLSYFLLIGDLSSDWLTERLSHFGVVFVCLSVWLVRKILLAYLLLLTYVPVWSAEDTPAGTQDRGIAMRLEKHKKGSTESLYSLVGGTAGVW